MEIINYIKVHTESRNMFPDRNILGVQGENEVEKLVFKLDKFFGGEARLETKQNDTLKYLIMETDTEKEEYSIVLTNELLKDYLSIDLQIRIINENGTVFKSKSEPFEILEGINATQEIVESQTEWVDEVDTRLDKAEADIEDLKQNGTGGGSGTDKTKLSQFENDTEFITKEVNNLLYYYNKEEVENLLKNVSVDLTGYAKEEWVKVQLANYLTSEQILELVNNALTNYYNKTEIDNLLANKVQKVEYSKDQTFGDGSDGGVIGRAYMVFRDGTQNSIVLNCQNVKYSVPVRDAAGNFYVGTPTQVYHCATKGYVDGIIIKTISNNTLLLTHNQDARLGELDSLILNMPNKIDNIYKSLFSFRSGETPTTLTYSATPIKWRGDDCNEEGEFIPKSNVSYEVSIRKVNDTDIVARVQSY